MLEIDTFGDADRIGAPVWRSPSQPDVDTSSPTVYRRLSFARIAGRIHLQLNYVLWFPERPVTGPLDILGGRLDGITLRITLDEGGRAVMYDAMHNCGCYHMFIPTPRMRRREGAGSYDEPPLIPQPVPVRIGSPVLRIAHRTHYVQRLYDGRRTRPREHFERHSYELSDYDELRSIPTENGRRSLFGPDGIVPGTERRERWLFWPMGVRSPGAMRQWGHHAIAFIGRRHFDDPDWIERFFQLNED